MNQNRTDFTMPTSHKIVITPYWFLGFSEGESTFLVSPDKGHRYLIGQTERQKEVLLPIKELLISELGNSKDAFALNQKLIYLITKLRVILKHE